MISCHPSAETTFISILNSVNQERMQQELRDPDLLLPNAATSGLSINKCIGATHLTLVHMLSGRWLVMEVFSSACYEWMRVVI